MPPSALEYHRIKIGNPIFGQARLIDIGLPQGWELAPGLSHPEVMATHERRGHLWVVAGQAWYVVYRPQERWALELAIQVRAAPSAPLSAGQGSMCAYAAAPVWKTRRRGLPWKRHDVTFATLAYECPHTERRITLEFSGWCPREGFLQMLEAARQWRCH